MQNSKVFVVGFEHCDVVYLPATNEVVSLIQPDCSFHLTNRKTEREEENPCD